MQQQARQQLLFTERASGWKAALNALSLTAQQCLLGPRISLYGKCGVGKSSLINAIIGWDLVPTGESQRAVTQQCISLVSTGRVGGSGEFRIITELLTRDEWQDKVFRHVERACTGGDHSRPDRQFLLDVYEEVEGLLDADLLDLLRGESELSDQQLQTLRDAIEFAFQEGVDGQGYRCPVVNMIEGNDRTALFGPNTSDDNTCGM